MPHKKTGRPLLIGEELDMQVQEYIKDTMKPGLATNTTVVIAAGDDVVMADDANQLADNGGKTKLTDDSANN